MPELTDKELAELFKQTGKEANSAALNNAIIEKDSPTKDPISGKPITSITEEAKDNLITRHDEPVKDAEGIPKGAPAFQSATEKLIKERLVKIPEPVISKQELTVPVIANYAESIRLILKDGGMDSQMVDRAMKRINDLFDRKS